MDKIFIIQEILINPQEKRQEKAIRYHDIGFTDDEDEAKHLYYNGKIFTRVDCWAIKVDERLPQFKFRVVERVREINLE